MDLAAAETLLFHTRWFLSQMLLFQLIYLGYRLLHPKKILKIDVAAAAPAPCRMRRCAVASFGITRLQLLTGPADAGFVLETDKSLNLLAEPDRFKVMLVYY